jgi:hypothetical protein
MNTSMPLARREFLRGLTLAGTTLLGGEPASVAAEPALETTRINLVQITGIWSASIRSGSTRRR